MSQWFEQEISQIDIEPVTTQPSVVFQYGLRITFSDQSRLHLQYEVDNPLEETDPQENMIISRQSFAARILERLLKEVLELRPDLDWRPPTEVGTISYFETGEIPSAFSEDGEGEGEDKTG